MKKALLSLALAAFAANAAIAATPSVSGTKIETIKHDTIFILQAYPVECTEEPLSPTAGGDSIAPNACFNPEPGQSNILAVPGVFCLGQFDEKRNHEFDVEAFVTLPEGVAQFNTVQSYRLTKKVAPSEKCPNTFSARTYYQFGDGVRTWWTLLYTSPGTQFILEITSVGQDAWGKPRIWKDVWTWEVAVTFQSLVAALDAMHTIPLGLCEVPCISAETLYAELRQGVLKLEDLVGTFQDEMEDLSVRSKARVDAQDLLFNLEAMIVMMSSFIDCFVPEECFSGEFPPSNEISLGDFGFTGMVDSIENPCACKVLADLEELGEEFDITSN